VPRCLITLALVLAACGGREVRVDVAIPGPDSVDAPVANLPLIVLSYDRDSIISLLEAKATAPTGIKQRLDTLFHAFQKPFHAYVTASLAVTRTQDSLARLKVRLDSMPRSAPDYAFLYRRFNTLSDSLADLAKRRDAAQLQLKKARDTLAAPIDSLRELMSRWQDSTYKGYDSIVDRLNNVVGRQPIPDTTGADGSVTIRLPNGDWWVYARSWVADDPNAEWYWNIPIRSGKIVLDRTTGKRQARY
jgi:hypothetical protein